MPQPTVTVIIPTWNGQEKCAVCLEHVARQTLRPQQIILVDNASHDGTASFVQKNFPWVEVIALAENRGTAGGHNAGLQKARSQYIVTLNNDAYITPTWLEAFVTALEADSSYAFAACRLLQAGDEGRLDSAGDGYDLLMGGVMLGHGEQDGAQWSRPREVFSATGGAALYRREIYDTTGPFDETLFMYSDDIDLAFRARLQGYRCLYVPTAIAIHEGGGTIGRLSPRQIRFIYRNRITVHLKNMPGAILRTTWPRLLRCWAGAVRHAPHVAAASQGTLEAFLRLPHTLRQRRHIQQTRRVSDATVWGWFENS